MPKGGSAGTKSRRASPAGNGAYNYKHGGSHGGATVAKQRDRTRRQAPRLLDDPANDERLLNAQLRRLGLYAANTLGDGSCLFRALSDQLHGTPNYHHVIRQNVCSHLLAHSSEFIAFIDDSNHSSPEAAFAAHVAQMRLQATYGTQVEIVAFARMVGRRVKVIQSELVYVIGCEDESPAAKQERLAQSQTSPSSPYKGKAKAKEESLPDLYIVYHNWEHYSSARNMQGPHTGLPCIVEQVTATTDATESTVDATASSKATQEESLVLSSLRFPHRHTVPEIRKKIQDCSGSWEQALEILLENEVDETESEDFNSPGPAGDIDSPDEIVPQPALHSIPALPRLPYQPPQPSGLHHHFTFRSSSPSASSSTATSSTQHSNSTTATHLSEAAILQKHGHDLRSRAIEALSVSPMPSSGQVSSRVRSRAASPDLDIHNSESPRQRFRITRTEFRETNEDAASSVGGDDALSQSTSESTVSSVATPEDADTTIVAVLGDGDTLSSPTAETVRPEPRKRGRPPKKRDGVPVARLPTRRQRKELAKSGGTGSPVGARTRSKVPPVAQDATLQRGFKELYV